VLHISTTGRRSAQRSRLAGTASSPSAPMDRESPRGWDNTVRVLGYHEGKRIRGAARAPSKVASVDFSPDGLRIVTAHATTPTYLGCSAAKELQCFAARGSCSVCHLQL